jgi:hypothetical protein
VEVLKCASWGAAESAGLRVPIAGYDEEGLPYWLCHGGLFKSLRAERSGVGPVTVEKQYAPVTRLTGPSAVEHLHDLQKVRGAEQPIPSSEELLVAPIISPGLVPYHFCLLITPFLVWTQTQGLWILMRPEVPMSVRSK